MIKSAIFAPAAWAILALTAPAGAAAQNDLPIVRIATLVDGPWPGEFDDLVQGLIERKLPSFSYLGESEVRRGIVAGLNPDMFPRLARRIALNVQRILLGDDPGSIPTAFSAGERLMLNTATARAIGKYPDWGVITEAVLVGEEPERVERHETLASVMEEAMSMNLDLAASIHTVNAGKAEVGKARSNLLPRIDLSALGLAIDEDRAALGNPPERSFSGTAETAELEMPLGTRIERTEEIVKGVEGFIREHYLVPADEETEGVLGWGSFIGQGAPRFYLSYNPEQKSSNYAFIILNATSRKFIDGAIPELDAFCLEQYPDLTANFKPLLLGPGLESPVEVRVSGEDPGILFDKVEAVKAKLGEIAGRPGHPRDPALGGRGSGQRGQPGKPERLFQLTGRNVPLKQVADIQLAWEPSKIMRRDRLKTVTVGSQLEAGFTAPGRGDRTGGMAGPGSEFLAHRLRL